MTNAINIHAAPDYRHILVGVDATADAQKAFSYAIKRAVQDHARLTIVSVLEIAEFNVYEALTPSHVINSRAELDAELDGYVEAARAAGVAEVDAIITEGNPGEVIIEDVIPHVNPDLLIIGAETKTGFARHFGSQAAYMAKYSPISILIVR